MSPLSDKVVNAALLTATLLNSTLMTTKVTNAKLTAKKALNAIPTVTMVLNENLAMANNNNNDTNCEAARDIESRCPGRKKNIARGKKSTIPADGACPPSQTAACFPIQIDLSFQAANIQDLGATELVNALSSLAGDPFSNEWLGIKTTQSIMDLDVHPESDSKTFSVVWLPDEPDVPSILALFMTPRNMALKV
ncbi:hypothetical protein PsorP6_009238 [Peronosclerospora sorghi]|uniref:Uncharacterized protein n=1 Tax=Peronosclerospora sorghi TaxID=230839 RepID=A0ACC0W1R6_9STRA|nr:hypothetical protein PsorP6_009238 [Peronosclerospora sorghi]